MKKLKFLLLTFTVIISGCTAAPTLGTIANTSKKTTDSTTSPVSTKNKLDLSNNGLTKISQDIFQMTNLQELDISNNKLTGALPAEIRHLQKLQVLNASNNQMTGVPAEIGQLSNLRILNLSNNRLTGLPYELGNLKNLEMLNLSGNNYSTQDLEIIRQGLSVNVNIVL